MAEAKEAIEIGGVRLTSPEKVLYPEQGITKRDLAEYYLAVADWMLPHLVDRPVTMVRCPTGRQKKCFYQRHAGSGVPKELGQVEIEGFEESGAYLYIRDIRGVLSMVQMGVLEIHPWGSKVDDPSRPDRLIFDLDPGEGLLFADVMRGAHELRALLQELGLEPFLKTTGGKGLHLIVPLARTHDWSQVKRFARHVGDLLSERAPERFLTRISKAEREGRIFIDYLRNDATSTAIAPYSTRSRPGAPVSVPIAWDELADGFDPSRFTVCTVPQRLVDLQIDPWAGIRSSAQTLPPIPEAAAKPRRPRKSAPSA
jgi:bifunctional non-homologous end joining protein LigD